MDHLLRKIRRRRGAQPLQVPLARQVPPHPAGLQGVVRLQSAPDRRVRQLAESKIEAVPAAVVMDLQQQAILARLEVEGNKILVGGRAAGDVV